MKLEELPYFKIFTPEERTASQAAAGYVCSVCQKIAFYSSVLNLEDHPQLLPLLGVVCVKCRKKYNASYERKRQKYFVKTKTANEQKL